VGNLKFKKKIKMELQQFPINSIALDTPLAPGEQGTFVFERRNDWDREDPGSVIRDATPACGCTVPSIVGNVITATFTMPYDTPAGSTIQKTIFVNYVNGHREGLYLTATAAIPPVQA
jgi:hypothetical protein